MEVLQSIRGNKQFVFFDVLNQNQFIFNLIKSHHRPLLYFQSIITVLAYIAMLLLLKQHFPEMYTSEKVHLLMVFIIVPLIISIIYFSNKYQHIHLTNSSIIVTNVVSGKSISYNYDDIKSTEVIVNEGKLSKYFEEIFIDFKDGKQIVISADIFSNYVNLKEVFFTRLHKESLVEG